MNLSKMKNFLIITLVITAVYQTGMLWLDDTTSHNFFYTVFNTLTSGNKVEPNGVSIINPEKIVVGYGNKKFSVIYPKTDYSTIISSGNDVIKEVIAHGEYIETAAIDWNEYLDSKAMVYDFSFSVAATEYVKGYKEKGNVITSRVRAFNYIITVPSRTETEWANVYFVDSNSGEAYKFGIVKSKKGATLYSEIEKFQQNNKDLVYVSTSQSGFYLFKKDVFVPQWSGKFLYAPLIKTNPYETNGQISISDLGSSIDSFFTDFGTKMGSRDEANNVYMFSDGTTVVKYYPMGVLEYYNYNSYDTNAEQTLASAYNACVNFMKKDSSLLTDVYLSDVKIESEGLIFYFDYTVNDLPINISDNVKEQLGITHAIEVVVGNGAVKKYKKYVYNFKESDQKNESVDTDFLSALSVVTETIVQVNDIELGYMVDESDFIGLKWLMKIDNKVYICDVADTNKNRD